MNANAFADSYCFFLCSPTSIRKHNRCSGDRRRPRSCSSFSRDLFRKVHASFTHTTLQIKSPHHYTMLGPVFTGTRVGPGLKCVHSLSHSLIYLPPPLTPDNCCQPYLRSPGRLAPFALRARHLHSLRSQSLVRRVTGGRDRRITCGGARNQETCAFASTEAALSVEEDFREREETITDKLSF